MQGSLKGLLKKKKKLSEIEAVAWIGQIIKDYEIMAKKNKMHRDLKPENILYIELENGKLQFKIGDFGLAKTM
jgi:eukaryotic-like serine/threonine-protein kinase